MRSGSLWAKGLVTASLLTGLFFTRISSTWGQGAPARLADTSRSVEQPLANDLAVEQKPAAPTSNPPPASIPSEILDPGPAAGPEGNPGGEDTKPFLATNPPVSPLPRLAVGYIPPPRSA